MKNVIEYFDIRFAFNLSNKIHSSMKIHMYISDILVIYRLFIKQPCIDSFTKRY